MSPHAPPGELDAADALVFFGATGDLAYKQIFPALQRMVANGELKVPVDRRGQERLGPRRS